MKNTLFALFCTLAAVLAEDVPGLKTLKIGDPAPAFELIGIDEEKHTLAEYAKSDLLMIAFISNHCPTSQRIESRLKKLVADHKGIEYVYWICSFLPLLGLLTVFLPGTKQLRG